MKCPKCNVVKNIPFYRINPKGEIGIFWCADCLKKHEPELFKNERGDVGDIIDAIESVFSNVKHKTIKL
jgi:protein-arginine kinase activator protein McsA